ncbi:hypothetical protein QBC41DRAFT_49313 [Cercophora samala]|uniref:Uncharacterized protein n=1 Tax=Cercophora samala TaxID=330535 RepID=A0AA39ZIJ1_9PEZI|nr:hypothetical protein QBC41DRAFT_49313 [Cercophora samala]
MAQMTAPQLRQEKKKKLQGSQHDKFFTRAMLGSSSLPSILSHHSHHHQRSTWFTTTQPLKMALDDPPSKNCSMHQRKNEQAIKEIATEMKRRRQASQKSRQTLEKPEKANIAAVAETPKEMVPTQHVVKSEPAEADAPVSSESSRRSKLESKKSSLAEKLSKGEITPAEYERAMCLLWDRPKLSEDGEWVIVGSEGPSDDESENSVDDSEQSKGGGCVLM